MICCWEAPWGGGHEGGKVGGRSGRKEERRVGAGSYRGRLYLDMVSGGEGVGEGVSLGAAELVQGDAGRGSPHGALRRGGDHLGGVMTSHSRHWASHRHMLDHIAQ